MLVLYARKRIKFIYIQKSKPLLSGTPHKNVSSKRPGVVKIIMEQPIKVTKTYLVTALWDKAALLTSYIRRIY